MKSRRPVNSDVMRPRTPGINVNGLFNRQKAMMHHYPYILSGGHGLTTGTDVFFLPKEKVFYLWGDCGMNHMDILFGPFAGDPRVALKKLADETSSK